MDKLIDVITERRARRAIDSKKIPDEVLDRMLTAATYAPSCSNNQPWRFIAVTDSAVLGAVKQHLTKGNYWAKTAPLIIAVCADPADDCNLSAGREYAFFDTGMATMNLQLQAVAEGLYVHPIAGFSPEPIREILGVPDDTVLITLVIAGYPGTEDDLNESHRQSEHGQRSRKKETEVIAYERWPGSWKASPSI